MAMVLITKSLVLSSMILRTVYWDTESCKPELTQTSELQTDRQNLNYL